MNRFVLIPALVLTTLLVAATGCGLPADDTVTPYDQDLLPPQLDVTTTTTTTTTTTLVPPATVAPPISQETTTTIVQTTQVDVFYVIGISDELQQLTLRLPVQLTIDTLIEQLEEPPPDAVSFNLRSAVEVDLIESVIVDRGVATVALSEPVLSGMSGSQERRAIAQIVLTLTRFVTPDGGIGQVRFIVDDEPIRVFLPERGTSEPGEPVAFDDFRSQVRASTPTDAAGGTTNPPSETTEPEAATTEPVSTAG